MPHTLDAMLSVARAAVRQAARLCAAIASDDPARLEKRGREPVTLADYGSQALILRAISNQYPDHRIMAEEGSRHLLDHAGDEGVAELCALISAITGEACARGDLMQWIDYGGGSGTHLWAIDPIDGTKGFLRGDQFAIAVGLLAGDDVVGGVLGCPRFEADHAGGTLFWGGRGLGAWSEPVAGGEVRPAAVSDQQDPAQARVLGSVEPSHGDPALVQAVIGEAGLGGGWVRLDSQVKYGAIAAGLAEIYIRPRSRPMWRERIWDHAAGAAIVVEAGGTVTDLDGAALDFTAGTKMERNRGVLATNGGAVHRQILNAIATVESD